MMISQKRFFAKTIKLNNSKPSRYIEDNENISNYESC
jgi:hypothetical protein